MILEIIKPVIESMKTDQFVDWLHNKEAYHSSGFVKDLILENDCESIIKKIKYLPDLEIINNEVVLYRALSHDSDIRIKKIGVCWSFDKKHAYCYRSNNKSKNYYLYQSKVNIDTINWPQTIQKSLSIHAYEREIRLIEDTNILIESIEERRKTICDLVALYSITYESTV